MTATPSQITRLLPADELATFGAGRHRRAHRLLGAHPGRYGDADGTRFAVWAPNAASVAVVGDFNGWDPARNPLAACGDSGVWVGVVPAVGDGALYKYAIVPPGGGPAVLKLDPYGRRFELRPRTAAVVTAPSAYRWRDDAWLRERPDWQHAPMSIYEMHAGSWRRDASGGLLGYRQLADDLAAYLVETGFTHIELMPVTEYPLDESWGYQCTGFFAPTGRYGEPDDLRYFVDTMHAHRIGVILDWVPGHFPRDDHALSRYDGTALYEHADPRRADTPEWGTLKFNYVRNEVRSFLVSSAIHWLEEFHMDGLRVDAVASMLYLDYGHDEGGWVPNAFGGREDLDAVEFLRQLNEATHSECPGTVTIAEESTDWPGVSRPAWLGGLGFSMKWDMGWMHDSLDYLHHEPVHRHYHHDKLTFGLMYAHSENFVLPLSHDEVVHGKGSLYARMPGDAWRKHANLRLLYAWQFTRPGKKLLFMGSEFAARNEWDASRALDWALLDDPACAGMRTLVSDLNRLYRDRTALHAADFDHWGFEWIDCHDAEQSVLSFIRRSSDDEVLVVLNFTPVPRYGYRVGAPGDGRYRELLNTDAAIYDGSNVGNLGAVDATPEPWMHRSHSLHLTLPPLGAVILAR